MRPRGPLGATLRRLRGCVRPVPAADVELVEAIEAGAVVPSMETLDALGQRLGLGLPARGELEWARRRTLGAVRAGRFRLRPRPVHAA